MTVFLVAIIICIFDFKLISEWLHLFISWVQTHPYSAILAIVCLYSTQLALTIPITLNHILFGYTYSLVFASQLKGFFFTVPVSMTGVLTGSMMSFWLSRYLFQDIVRAQID